MRICEQLIRGEFERRFQAFPTNIVRAPGRVNLIGEHTDYNDGFVMPLAIDRAVWIAFRPRQDQRVIAHSLDFAGSLTFALDDITQGNGGWMEYVKAVAWAMRKAGYSLHGWEGVIAGDVPVGAGLSSSAALEMAVARTFAAVSDIPWDPATMALLGQRAENEWVGVRCGIMDQLISAGGRAGHALLIDCRSLHFEAVPLPPQTTVIVLDTATRRSLVGSAYNERRSQCEAAARAFGVAALRDVSSTRFEEEDGRIDALTRQRARHVIRENERTLQAADAMRRGDANALGRLMNASHESLRDDYGVSSRELDAMVECGREHPTCLGIRMTGAGFGGCLVALVRSADSSSFSTSIVEKYQVITGLVPAVYICEATDGAEIVS